MQFLFEHLELTVPIALALLAGSGWLIQRKVTRQADVEDHASLERTINLQKLLREEGMTLEQAKALREEFRRTKGGLTGAEAAAVVAKVADAERREASRVLLEPPNGTDLGETTVGMGIKAQAELEVLEETLDFVVQQFRDECTPARQQSLDEAQLAWRIFRDKDAVVACLLAEGGTMASIIYVSHQITLTEQRIRDIRLMQADSNL